MQLGHFRTVGIDDGAFHRFSRQGARVPIVAVGLRKPETLEVVRFSSLLKDGTDSTDVIISLLEGIRDFAVQSTCVFTSGITFGGFNVADLERINKVTGLPVASVCDREPDLASMRKVLEEPGRFRDAARRIDLLERQFPYEVRFPWRDGEASLWCRGFGIAPRDLALVIEESCVNGKTPESLRVAHMAASASSALLSEVSL